MFLYGFAQQNISLLLNYELTNGEVALLLINL